jgi:hypothetical protein
MKRRQARLPIFAMGLVVTLIMPLYIVELTTAQDQIIDAMNVAPPNEENIKIWRDILMGRIDDPPGAKDYVLPKNAELLPRPTSSLEQDQLIVDQNKASNLRMSRGIAAGYQVFDGGCAYAQTSSVTNLVADSAEYQVMHQWPTSGENAIVIWYYPNEYYSAIFGIYSSVLGGYQDWAYFDADDSFTLAIRPNYSTGTTSYSSITYYIYDDTTSTLWEETYNLGTTQYIDSVDYALEQGDSYEANSVTCAFTGFFALDEDFDFVNLQSTFRWLEWENDEMYNLHNEVYYDGGYTASLFQTKYPK